MKINRHAQQTLETLSAQFIQFAERDCANFQCELYANFGKVIADDKEILALTLDVRPGQPAPNLLFGAIHYILLKEEKEHPLRNYYDTLVDKPLEITQDTFQLLQSFVKQNMEEIKHIVSTRAVQTSEVSRSSSFLPAILLASKYNNNDPFHFIDAGSGIGFSLLWDEYFYEYKGLELRSVGDKSSSVKLECKMQGRFLPDLEVELGFPKLASRIGLELEPINIFEKDHILWLQALIWPNQIKRRNNFEVALQLLQERNPKVVGGDVKELLPKTILEFNDQNSVLVLFSFSANQIYSNGRSQLSEEFRKLSNKNAIYEISLGYFDDRLIPSVILAEYRNGRIQFERVISHGHTYGEWIEFL